MSYRLGIMGTGRITYRFVPELNTVDGIELVSVYNPRLLSARNFAEKWKIEHYTDKLEKFVGQVDAVYIATPHETHADYARFMLKAGKHVLCEKPLCFSKAVAEELFVLAKENHCVLMEGIKTAYAPGFQGILEVVQSGKIGKVVDIESCFSRLPETNMREVWDENFGGSFIEYGTYSLLPIVKIYGIHKGDINFFSIDGITGVDIYTKTYIDFGDATGVAKTGLGVKSEGQLIIAGTKGYILTPSPWWLTRYFEVRFEDSRRIERYEFPFEQFGLRYEISEFLNRMDGIYSENGITDEESVWIAEQMEKVLAKREKKATPKIKKNNLGIWAHRGCSLEYPENTLSAFRAAAELNGIKGIELDVQLTKDSKLVVIHDETVNRTTNGIGNVCELSLLEMKELAIEGKDGQVERIPTLEEVYDILAPYCKEKGLLINVELKNSQIRYAGMEEKLLELAKQKGIEEYIIYSSFLPESMGMIKMLEPKAKTAILAENVSVCLEKAIEMKADALHPWNGGLSLSCNEYRDGEGNLYPVRVWNGEEPFFGQKSAMKEVNMPKYEILGATDIITNVPERYL